MKLQAVFDISTAPFLRDNYKYIVSHVQPVLQRAYKNSVLLEMYFSHLTSLNFKKNLLSIPLCSKYKENNKKFLNIFYRD